MRNAALKPTVPALLALALIFFLIRAGASYRPPPLAGEKRTTFESAADFFAFGWHYSREVWLRQSRNWPAAERARLLGFQIRPGHPIYADLRKLSLFELGRAYERAGLQTQAAEIYLQARQEAPGNLWLQGWVDDKLRELNRGNAGMENREL